jgi:beta-mannosidase
MHTVELSSGWKARRLNDPAMPWIPASAPGHIHCDLLKAGIIADPFVRMQEMGCQWVDRVDWEYETTFEAVEVEPEEKVVLDFAGLDSVGEVHLNGEKVADFESMHIPLRVDVTGRLQESNTLRIVFFSPYRVGDEKRAAYFSAHGLPENTRPFPERAFVRKAQYMYGWDWGPQLASVGIWLPAEIQAYQGRLDWVWPRQDHREDGSVMLSLSCKVEGKGKARYRLTSPSGEEWTAEDPEAQILISSPMLWWPNGQGAQPLYTLVTELVEEGKVLDTSTLRVGLRTIEVRETPDEDGISFEFVVNGRPIFAAGSNWIPDHSFPSLPDRERIFSQVKLAKDMNQNMLRVWGGGLFETEDFYDACDEMGILVWQDFPYGCSYSPDDEEWQKLAVAEAEANVPRLRSRTCLAIWCGNNENETMHDSRWGGDAMPSRVHGEKLWDEAIPQALTWLDPDRLYIPSSPTGPKGKANGDDQRDVHNWAVWHGSGDWRSYRTSRARFVSEFGFASSCGHQAWDLCLSAEDKEDPRSLAVQWHDKTGKGYEKFLGYIEAEYPSIQTLDDLVYYGQLNQRDAMRFALHHYRTAAPCRGALIWQHNDCWPVQSWALVDYAQVVKAAGEEMARCFANQLIVIQPLEETVELWVANDGGEAVSGDLKATLFSTESGDALAAWSFPGVSVEPASKKLVKTWQRSELGQGSFIMEAAWPGAAPCVSLLQKAKDTRLGQTVIRAKAVGDGYEVWAEGAPAVDVMIRDRAYAPRFFTLLPGRKTRVEGKSLVGMSVRTLAGESVIQKQR